MSRLSGLIVFFTVFSIFLCPDSFQFCDTIPLHSSQNIGDIYYREGMYKEALHAYGAIISRDSMLLHDSAFRMKVGIAAYHSNNCSLAVIHLDTAYVADPDLREYCLYYRARSFYKVRKYEDALHSLQGISATNASRLIIHDAAMLKINVLCSLRRFRSANGVIAMLINATRDPSEKSELNFLLANNYFALSEYPNGYRTIRNLTDRFPKTPAAVRAVELYMERKSVQKKILTFQELDWAVNILIDFRRGLAALRVIENYPADTLRAVQLGTFHYHKARALYYAGQTQKAIELFQNVYAASSVDLHRSGAQLYLARCFLQMKETDKAIDRYIQFVTDYPAHSMVGEILWKLGWLFESRKEYSRALQYYKRLEKGRTAYRERGIMRAGLCCYETGAFSNAILMFGELARGGTEESMKEGGLYWLAMTLKCAGDSTKAQRTFERLLAQYPLHYYSFRARERLALQDTVFAPQYLNIDSILAASENLPEDSVLLKTVRIAEIAGRRYGEAELNALQDTPRSLNWIADTLWHAYYRIGAFSGALRIAIRQREYELRRGAALPPTSILWRAYPPFYYTLVHRYAGENDLPPALVFALMRRESAFDAAARSSAGAVGLMQLLPETAEKIGPSIGVQDVDASLLTQAEWNIRLGNRYLKDQINSFNGMYVAALAAYNAGPAAVRRWMSLYGIDDVDSFVEKIEYTETRNYVKRVLGDFWMYQYLYDL